MVGRALWFIPSARSIPVFWDWVNRVDFVDKLIIKNHQWDTAVDIARHFFFRQEYDYFFITSDDVIGYPDHVKMLIQDVEEHEFQIISGWCNHLGPYASLSVEPMDPEVLKGSLEKPYPGLNLEDYKFVHVRDLVIGKYGYPFVKAWFNGCPLALFRRDALKAIPFRAWRYLRDKYCMTALAKKKGRPVMADIPIAIDCVEKNIPLMTDVRIFLYHIFGTRGILKVGTDKPWVGFVESKNEKRSKDEIAEINALIAEASDMAWDSGRVPLEP